ncbi:MAG: tetratricopeptide repeat protein [Bacteroidota bacterium]
MRTMIDHFQSQGVSITSEIKRWLFAVFLVIPFLMLAQSPTHPQKQQGDSLSGSERLIAEMIAMQNKAPEQTLILGRQSQKEMIKTHDPVIISRFWYSLSIAFQNVDQVDSLQVCASDLRKWALREESDLALLTSLLIEGNYWQEKKEYPQALRTYEEALERNSTVKDQNMLVLLRMAMGDVYIEQKEIELGKRQYDLALESSEGLEEARTMARLYDSLMGYFYSRDFQQAVHYQEKALQLWEAIGDEEKLMRGLSNLSISYMNWGKMDSGQEILIRLLRMSEDHQAETYKARALASLAIIYSEKGDNEEAISMYVQALELAEKNQNKFQMGYILFNLGNLYGSFGDYEVSISRHQQALNIWKDLGNEEEMAICLTELGRNYKNLEQYDKALELNLRGLAIQQQLGNTGGMVISMLNIGSIHRILDKHEEALVFFQDALKLAKELNASRHISSAYYRLMNVHIEMDSLELALAYADSAMFLTNSIQEKYTTSVIFLEKSKVLERLGKHAEALAAFRNYAHIKDSLYTSDSQTVLAELQQQYKTKEQQQRIELLEQEQEIQKLWTFGLMGGLGLLAIIAGLVYNRYRIKTRAHEALMAAHSQLKNTQLQLIQAEKMASLGQMTAGIAHEIKNPLNFVNNFARNVRQIAGELSEEIREFKDRIERQVYEDIYEMIEMMQNGSASIEKNGKRVDQIVSSMMQHSQASSGERRLVDLNQILKENVLLAHQGIMAQRSAAKVEIHHQLDSKLPVFLAQPQELSRALLNILNNAYEAVAEHINEDGFVPMIHIETQQVADELILSVKDNGPGISPENKDHLFDPFFTTKVPGKGNVGLGLSIAYDILVDGHKGKIDVDSVAGEGTTFIIHLPLSPTTG